MQVQCVETRGSYTYKHVGETTHFSGMSIVTQQYKDNPGGLQCRSTNSLIIAVNSLFRSVGLNYIDFLQIQELTKNMTISVFYVIQWICSDLSI